jgi:hypothetical protein
VSAVVGKSNTGLKGTDVQGLKCTIDEVAVIISQSFVQVYAVCSLNIGELPCTGPQHLSN